MTGKSIVPQQPTPSPPGSLSPWRQRWIWGWLGVGPPTRCRILWASLSRWSWVRARSLFSVAVCSSQLTVFPPHPVGPVPVGGDVIVEVDYLYGVDSKLVAARLHCRISRGTFPHVSWLLNASVLLSDTPMDHHRQPLLSYYGLADNGRTLFLTSLGPEESGYYRCRARDSYDGSGPWVESKGVLVKVTGDQIIGVIKVILKQETFLQ